MERRGFIGSFFAGLIGGCCVGKSVPPSTAFAGPLPVFVGPASFTEYYDDLRAVAIRCPPGYRILGVSSERKDIYKNRQRLTIEVEIEQMQLNDQLDAAVYRSGIDGPYI